MRLSSWIYKRSYGKCSLSSECNDYDCLLVSLISLSNANASVLLTHITEKRERERVSFFFLLGVFFCLLCINNLWYDHTDWHYSSLRTFISLLKIDWMSYFFCLSKENPDYTWYWFIFFNFSVRNDIVLCLLHAILVYILSIDRFTINKYNFDIE